MSYVTRGTLQCFERSAQTLTITGICNVTPSGNQPLSGSDLTTLTLAIYSQAGEQIVAPRDVRDGLTGGVLTTTLLPDDLDVPPGRTVEERLLVIRADRGLTSELNLQWRLLVDAVAGASAS